MDCGWDCNLWKTTADKLQHSHLSCGILHSNSVWSESKVAGTSFNILSSWIINMRVKNLL